MIFYSQRVSYTQEMKRDNHFWSSLEEYSRVVAKRSPLPSSWIVTGVAALIIVASIFGVKASFASITTYSDAALRAASLGDYPSAKKFFNASTKMLSNDSVLGVKSELEDKIYPENIVEKKIIELEEKMTIYPGNREIFIELSALHAQLGNQEIADEYREKARILDPNNIDY